MVEVEKGEKAFTESEVWEMVSILEKDSKHPLGELLYAESL
jgi:hypothetical protein